MEPEPVQLIYIELGKMANGQTRSNWVLMQATDE
jgi:hypothetical protein